MVHHRAATQSGRSCRRCARRTTELSAQATVSSRRSTCSPRSRGRDDAVGTRLRGFGLDRQSIEQAVEAIRESLRLTDPDADGTPLQGSWSPLARSRHLARFSRDLTELALQDELDPVIGREREIVRVVQVLARRTKNNPVLIGELGVGKTAIAQGLPRRIVLGQVPVALRNRRGPTDQVVFPGHALGYLVLVFADHPPGACA